jgi:hypothetical protein
MQTWTPPWTWTISSSAKKLVLQSIQHLIKDATEPLAPNKLCDQFSASILKTVRRLRQHLCYFGSTILIGAETSENKIKGAPCDLHHLLIFEENFIIWA